MGLSWYASRLKAMSLAEMVYRVSQKRLFAKERKAFDEKCPVYNVSIYGKSSSVDFSCLGLNLSNMSCSVGSEIELLGCHRYADYRRRWHAVFQGDGDWPLFFARDYNFSSGNVPGDIRTNWELNRHHQFVVLAKSFFVTRDLSYLEELNELFIDWNEKNPFMWGPEWASSMELSIRLVNWLMAAAFLDASKDVGASDLIRMLCSGAFVMASNVRYHFSRFSSANNHTIVEAAGVVVAACVFNCDDWRSEAVGLLEREVGEQTWPDGVNKEQALHYQLFVMEALCLASHALHASGLALPSAIGEDLRRMARYAASCRVSGSNCVEFGDNDEGVLFNPCCKKPFYLGYVLGLASLEDTMGLRWSSDAESYEALHWLFTREDFNKLAKREQFVPDRVESFEEGGITLLRSENGRIVLAFDHGPLGFGALAAHGHADALSIQLFVDGESVLIDSGTFVYNGNRIKRDMFRATRNHNTVCVNDGDQSEALGPFLWGRKAEIFRFALERFSDRVRVAAYHNGYEPIVVQREIELCDTQIIIVDKIEGAPEGASVAYLHLPLACACASEGAVEVRLRDKATVRIAASAPMHVAPYEWSPTYGVLAEGLEIAIPCAKELTTTIEIC